MQLNKNNIPHSPVGFSHSPSVLHKRVMLPVKPVGQSTVTELPASVAGYVMLFKTSKEH